MSSLPRIKTSQDWNNFIGASPQLDANMLFAMRQQCYADIEAISSRQQPFAAMGADVVKSSTVLLSTFVLG